MEKEELKRKRLEESERAFVNYKIEKAKIIENDLPLKGILKSKIYFPITQCLLYGITKASKEQIHYLNQKEVKVPKGRPILYVNTHRFKPDIEKITLSLSKPSVFMASDFKNAYKTISGWYLNTRPTIYVDPYDDEDKNYSYQMMVRYLKARCNFMICSEAVWNLSPNDIVLPIFSGAVRAALESNAIIVCSAIERYGKHYVINRKEALDVQSILSKFTNKSWEEISSNPIYTNKAESIITECKIALRDELATLLYEIYEAYAKKEGLIKRENIEEDYWEKYIQELVSEWPGYKLSDNIEQQYHTKEDIEKCQVEDDITNLRNYHLNINNLFLFTDDVRYNSAKGLVQEYEEKQKTLVKVDRGHFNA